MTVDCLDVIEQFVGYHALLKTRTGQVTRGTILRYRQGTAAWLAQLGERRTAVREVEGSSSRPDQHSGS